MPRTRLSWRVYPDYLVAALDSLAHYRPHPIQRFYLPRIAATRTAFWRMHAAVLADSSLSFLDTEPPKRDLHTHVYSLLAHSIATHTRTDDSARDLHTLTFALRPERAEFFLTTFPAALEDIRSWSSPANFDSFFPNLLPTIHALTAKYPTPPDLAYYLADIQAPFLSDRNLTAFRTQKFEQLLLAEDRAAEALHLRTLEYTDELSRRAPDDVSEILTPGPSDPATRTSREIDAILEESPRKGG